MAVYEGSRYENCEYTSIMGKDQKTRKWLNPRESAKLTEVDQDWVVHTVSYGDQLDALSFTYSGNNPEKSKLWWLIADVNNILWPLDLEPGEKLIIPSRMLAYRSM